MATTPNSTDPTPIQLNLSKTLDPKDYILLGEQLKIVDEHFDKESPQHEARRWEYAMCLRAIREWLPTTPLPRGESDLFVADVGGAGSPLSQMLESQGFQVKIIDPRYPKGPSTVEAQAAQTPSPRYDVITCISVIEHVRDEHVKDFLTALSTITAPGGLLFLTMDCWGQGSEEKDKAMFHWMRERIYTQKSWQALGRAMVGRGFVFFGLPDWDYHGDHVMDAYSFCSLAMTLQKKKGHQDDER